MSLLGFGIEAAERGLIPDSMTRRAMRRLCRARLRDSRLTPAVVFLESMRQGPIALVTDKANEQHYELPPEFFAAVLGPRLEIQLLLLARRGYDAGDAEEVALAATCEHAQIADGQEILELGCGWGSLSFWLAERYPSSRITAVSNSKWQRQYIASAAARRGLKNLRVITADMNDFAPPSVGSAIRRFDRVVSVEMFEHMRNYEKLLERIATWLRPEGKLFVQIFCHREMVYPFESVGAVNWMARHFFTGGIMPSIDLLGKFDRDVKINRQWVWNGHHYQRTSDAWLANLDARQDELLGILRTVYGRRNAYRWFNRWRMFFLAVAELFGYADGEEWCVAQYLLEPVGARLKPRDAPCCR